MKVALYLKFTQHEDLRQELLDTDDAELIEVGSSHPNFTNAHSVCRTRIRMHSGALAQTNRGVTNLERH